MVIGCYIDSLDNGTISQVFHYLILFHFDSRDEESIKGDVIYPFNIISYISHKEKNPEQIILICFDSFIAETFQTFKWKSIFFLEKRIKIGAVFYCTELASNIEGRRLPLRQRDLR